MTNVLMFLFGIAVGVTLGGLLVYVGVLQEQIKRAEVDGDRR